jgi:allantoate deiminase
VNCYADLAQTVLARCDTLAAYSEAPGKITRPFPSEAMHGVHERLRRWMEAAGLAVRRDAIGNLIGHYHPADAASSASIFLIGSHLDSVPDAGRYDGVLGVLLGLAALEALRGKRLPFPVEIIGFCEEEGIRFSTPFLGSLALAGRIDLRLLERTDREGTSLAEALRRFGLDPERVGEAAYPADCVRGYLEVHIEQGPVLENRNLPLGIVEAVAGQDRVWLRLQGKAGHAGTLPMELRRDALAAAAELVLAVEEYARSVEGLRATVGWLEVAPGAVNVVPGAVRLSLDVRHANDDLRRRATAAFLAQAEMLARRRGVEVCQERSESYPAVPADRQLTELLARAADQARQPFLRMISGAGHDAAIMAGLTPMCMLFVRSPGGISHHPDEAVLPADVAVALEVVVAFLQGLASGDLA